MTVGTWLLIGLVRTAFSEELPPDRTTPPEVAPLAPPLAPTVWTGTLGGDVAGEAVPVSVVERRSLPLVRVELSFDIRALSIPTGARDALGAVWGEGTATRRHGAWRAAIEQLGADLSVGCGAIRCWSALDVPTEHLAAALELAAENVWSPALAARAVARWRREALLEWRTDWLGPGLVHAYALGRLSLPPGHPFRVDRDRSAFAGGVPRVRDAWREVMGRASPSLVVVGDTSPEEVFPLLQRAFGALASERPAPRPVGPAQALVERRVFVHVPGANQARITVAWASPGADDPDRLSYTLAFRALAEGFTSRLSLRLREEEGLTYRVDATQRFELGRSEVTLAVDPTRLSEALASLASALDAPRHGGFGTAEIDAARSQLWMGGAAAATTHAGLARTLWDDHVAADTPGEWLIHLAMYQDVSIGDVNVAAARWLGGPRLWLVSGDGDVLEPQLDAAGWPVDLRWGACQAVYGGACP